jgi:hypothetical protein
MAHLEISKDVLDRLMNESIGAADISDSKLTDNAVTRPTHVATCMLLCTFNGACA